jgi:hypothetical protein
LTNKLFDKYKYGFGQSSELPNVLKSISESIDSLIKNPYQKINEFINDLDTFKTIRYEGILRALYSLEEHKNTFDKLINIINCMVKKIYPNKFWTLYKDKLNIISSKSEFCFKQHQDGCAKWNQRTLNEYDKFITIAFPFNDIYDQNQGSTNITIRSTYEEGISIYTNNEIVDNNKNNENKTYQYLNCLTQLGSYYFFDEWVLHSSSKNTSDNDRLVFFVTICISETEINKDDIMKEYYNYLDTSNTLTKSKIDFLINKSGFEKNNFNVNNFGKITIRKYDHEKQEYI